MSTDRFANNPMPLQPGDTHTGDSSLSPVTIPRRRWAYETSVCPGCGSTNTWLGRGGELYCETCNMDIKTYD